MVLPSIVVAAAAYNIRVPGPYDIRVPSPIRMNAEWRPKTVDPLGQAMGVPVGVEKPFSLWLDLRESEITFAQQVIIKLFFGVRRVVDEAGTALPKGSAVEGLLFDEARYDRADSIGQDLPMFVDTAAGFVNATLKDVMDPVQIVLQAPTTTDALVDAINTFNADDSDSTNVIALPADSLLWACALTGLLPEKLQCLEGNEGA